MSLWDELPSDLRNSGSLDPLRPALDSVATPASTERTESDGVWRVWTTSLGGTDPLSINPLSGEFSRGRVIASGANTPIEFPDPSVDIELALRLDAAGGSPDGTVRLTVETPSAIIRLPFLHGAYLDAQGQLRRDPNHRLVRFILPALRVRVLKPADGGIDVTLLSASSATHTDYLYEFVRMEPAYALIGPDEVVGFAFRTAVLDLSGTAGPSGVPAEARAMPGDWQGLYLPEVRLFVAPSGLEGLAVSAGVRNLWIGIGKHAGVTGVFEAEVVQRGGTPNVRLRFQTEAGEWIGVADTDPPPPVELPENCRVYVDAGGGLAPYSYRLTVNGTVTNADRASVTVPATGSVTIQARVLDAASHERIRTVTVQRRASAPPGGAAPPSSQAVAVGLTSSTGSRIVIESQTATHATVRLEPEGGDVAWAWGSGSANGPTANIPVAAGASVAVTATRTRPAGTALPVDAYMLFDRPLASTEATDNGRSWARNAENVHERPASGRGTWGDSPVLVDNDFTTRMAALRSAGISWTVEGWASYEERGDPIYNIALSARRRDALIVILQDLGFTATAGVAHGFYHALDGIDPDGGVAPPPGSSSWWRARATANVTAPLSETITSNLTRPPAPPPVPENTDPVPTRPPVPDCFRKIGVRVELVRSTFVRCEVYGEFDIQTAAEQRIAASSPGATLPARTNPSDGICAFLVRLRIDESRSSWDVKAEFRAIEGDLDGLAKLERRATGDHTGINILGAVTTLAPLLAAVSPPNPTAGELVPLVILGGTAVGLGAAGVIETQHVILRGGELVITDGLVDPASGDGPRTTQVSVLLDVETAFTFDLGIIRVAPDKPVTTRYKAVGVRSTWGTAPRSDGSIEYIPMPVFDPSRGYTLDVPAGSLVAAEPLGELLRILGVRTSRDNPTYLEVEVGLGVDLGIVTVDTVRVRLRLDQPEAPQLTKLGASIDVPGTLHGTGYVEITDAGFKGAFDLTVQPLNLRASAQLAVETRNGVTGVLVGAEVQFPVPLPLGNSGLALFGFLGGVGVNYGRREPTGVQAPALKWLEAQLAPSRNSVMHPDGWEHRPGSYAFAAGLLLGTAEGGFVVHLKGIVLIEVPGPRLMLVMKADVLKMPPVLKSQSNATFLAVLDLDFGRGTITIGIVAEYTIVSLLHIRVPVTAFFDTHHVEKWYVDLGNFTEPVTVSVLDVFTGVGYLMVHGDGIPHPRLPIVSTGLTIAVGFHLTAVLMGSKSAGLYLEVAAGFDALVSFEPFAIGGLIYARGELRLWIVSVSASAELTVLVGRQRVNGTEVERTYVHGRVCGKVEFFFFDVEGCVSLTLGSGPPDSPVAPPLVAGVKLVSRSPALIEGSAVDRAVDGSLGDAVAVGSGGELPSVPLDAVPAILFEVPPLVASGNVILGGTANGSSGLPADPWIRRGDRWWRYRVNSVELVGALQPAPPAGKTPATWWSRGSAGDVQQGPALALLSWLPTPFSRAVPYGEQLTETVTNSWGHVCGPVAKPAPVMWTFDQQPLGPSNIGWQLTGIPWPDDPGDFRSSPVDGRMGVREWWRTGDPLVDQLQGTDPAIIVGDAVPCPNGRIREVVSLKPWQTGQPLTFSRANMPRGNAGMQAAAELLASGGSLQDVNADWGNTSWDSALQRQALGCDGRILRSPIDDLGEPAPEGLEEERKIVKQAWEKLGFKPSELADSVVLHVAGGLHRLRALLLVPKEVSEKYLVLRYRDAKGQALGEYRPNSGDMVRQGRPIPATWTDPSGPWANPVERAGRMAGRVAAMESSLMPLLVELEMPKDVVEVEIGWDRTIVKDKLMPAFWVVAMEGMVTTEAIRADWDVTTVQSDLDALVTSVTQDPDDHALLVPGQTYTVRVTWQGESVKQDARPAANAAENWGDAETQEFQFVADPPNKAPRDLTPWVLATAPAMGETGVLCKEPIRLALATQKVAALFDAYGEELRVRVRSASGRHPEPPGGGAPGSPFTIPLDLGEFVKAAPNTLRVMSPWQQAATELLDALPCTNGSGSTTHHTVVELPYDLEPLTDYIVDVLAVPKGAPHNANGRRVHRVNFTTSRFGTVDELASLVRRSVVEHRLVPTSAPLLALGERPNGDQLDVAFQQAGLGVPEVPRYPRVQVLWSGDAVPQPVAVVIESSEALWRERPMPTVVNGPLDAADPAHQWWAARIRDWLSVSVRVPAAGDPPSATVTRLVHGPGHTRAVALLAPGARGLELGLDLVLTADDLAGTTARRAESVRVAFVRAPWEVED